MKKTMSMLLAALVASLLPAPSAWAAPTIELVSPSGYSTPPPEITDVEDSDGGVHVVAWAKEIPASSLVEFEIQPTGQNAATFTADRVGNTDTWEAFIPLPNTYTDGATYTLRARLYRGVAGDAEEVDNDEMTVEVNQSPVPPPDGAGVEIQYPDNGGGLGIFVPKGKRPVAVFDFAASDGTEQVRAFYSLSDPGTEPTWEPSCGSGRPVQGFGKVRCTLADGHNPLDVTAVALVANRTAPPAPPSPALDASGDAHRVFPYLQVPSSVEIAQGNATVNLSACHVMTAIVEDQFGRTVAGANVDVHADGPEDQLHFGTKENETDAFQAPDNAHVSRENAKDCDSDDNLNQQGDHNSPGRDDAKHIESTTGTSDNGQFRFALLSDFAGGTFIQAWADVDDDDQPDLNEASGGTQLGWGSPVPPPTQEVFLTPSSANGSTGSCVQLEILARRGGSPFANANVDVHLSGPDASVNFCDVSGGGTRRPPESGGHIGDTHEDATRHGEGETDGAGRFLFGVTSPTAGTTQVRVWIDSNDDDLPDGEPSRSATVEWSPPGERSISIESSKSTVVKGRRVRLSGEVEGDPSCSAGQTVNVQAKRAGGGRFGTVRTLTTDSEGSYSTRVKMRKARKFRAVAPEGGSCNFARSRTITVRTR